MDPMTVLGRRRDFISLILSYPMITGDKSILKQWMNGYFDQLRANNFTKAPVIHELYESDEWLQYVEPLIPEAIIQEMTLTRRFIFGISERRRFSLSRKSSFTKAIGSTGTGARQLSWTPSPDALEGIFDSATDLAVRQLIQTLISEDEYVRHIHRVQFSTRDDVEKCAVMKKIEVALKEEENKLKITQEFVGVLWIDLSKCENAAEAQSQVLQQISQHLERTMTTVDDNVMIRSCVEEEMMSRKYLVLVDGNWRLDHCQVIFEKTDFTGVVVWIATDTEDRRPKTIIPNMAMDLEIRTEDHVLSWELLFYNVGSTSVLDSIAIQRIAVEIVKECCGHLLAITLVARSLEHVGNVKIWEAKLVQLRYSNSSYDTNIFDGMSRVMINAFINIIWEDINEKELHCLAHCLFVPTITEGIHRDLLISHWAAVRTLYKEKELSHVFKKFVDVSVFLKRRKELRSIYLLPKEIYDILELLNCLKPVVINQMSLWINEPLEIGPARTQWQETLEVVLVDSGLSKMPQSPNFPRLRILCLQGNIGLIEIPPLFFNCTPLLQILNLSYTSIRDLPNSFSNLLELRELYLRGCVLLIELPSGIGRLKKLEKLDLDGTRIIHLPQEMRELTLLQSLILSFCGHPTRNVGQGKKKCMEDSKSIFPPAVISSLSRLVHLSIDVSSDDERWNEEAAVILREISGLERLQSLFLYVPEVKLLELILHCMCNLCLFKLVVGHHMEHCISRTPPAVEACFEKSDRSLKFINGVDIPYEIEKILGCTEAFFLHRHKTIRHLSQFKLEVENSLRVCILGECNEMQTIFDGLYMHTFSAFQIRSLSVFCMRNLTDICVGPSPHMFLMPLMSLTLHNCPNLTTIIPATLLGSLLHLEELIVEKCPKVITLISRGSTISTSGIYLNKLRKVSLLHLPELVSISSGFRIGILLEKIGFYDCPKLQSLSKSELSSSYLKVIKGEINWWEALKWSKAEWGQQGQPDHLRNIFCPIIEEADIMTQLFGDGI